MKKGSVVAVFVGAVALLLGSQRSIGSASETRTPQLSKEFKAAATEALEKVESLFPVECSAAAFGVEDVGKGIKAIK